MTTATRTWVRYFSKKGQYWVMDDTRFLIGSKDVVQVLPVPDLVQKGGRELYVFEGPFQVS